MKSPYLTKKSLIAWNYFDIGLFSYDKHTSDEEALEAFRKATPIYDKILPIDRETLAQLHDNMFMVYCRQKQWILAAQTYAKSCEYRFGSRRRNNFHILNSTCFN